MNNCLIRLIKKTSTWELQLLGGFHVFIYSYLIICLAEIQEER